jgi:polyhydroxybutyrate depolymerase
MGFHVRGKRWLRWLLALLVLLLAAPLALGLAFLIANRTNGSVESGGVSRSYLLHVPDSYKPDVPAPLVITIHGFAQWPAHQMELSGWHDLADEEGFIAVFPAGTGFPMRWSAGGRSLNEADPLHDVQFISDMIDQLEREYNIDPNRIYVNGLSNGGGMSFMLSCYLSDRIAAIGTVAGFYVLPWDECDPQRPVPLIAFHGTDDPIVPFKGGPYRSFDTPFPNITEWVAQAAEHNGCQEQQQLARRGDVSGVWYTGCLGGADVIYYQIEGGGHSWPGGGWLPGWLVGSINDDIDATRQMWAFFQLHPLNP